MLMLLTKLNCASAKKKKSWGGVGVGLGVSGLSRVELVAVALA